MLRTSQQTPLGLRPRSPVTIYRTHSFRESANIVLRLQTDVHLFNLPSDIYKETRVNKSQISNKMCEEIRQCVYYLIFYKLSNHSSDVKLVKLFSHYSEISGRSTTRMYVFGHEFHVGIYLVRG